MVTRRSILEYVQALRPRYRKATKEEKNKMLDEFVQVTGFHRKAAIRLLNRVNQLASGKRVVGSVSTIQKWLRR